MCRKQSEPLATKWAFKPFNTVMLAVGRGETHLKPERTQKLGFKLLFQIHFRTSIPRLLSLFRTATVMTWWEARPIIDEYAKMVTKILGLKSWSVPGTWNGWARPARHLDKAWNTSSKIISPVLSSCTTEKKHTSNRNWQFISLLSNFWNLLCQSFVR